MSEEITSILPFKGLVPYEEEDAPFFFGREKKRKVISANLMASRLTVLYGSSGVGKSSVLSAGVLHHLRELARRNVAEQGDQEFVVVLFKSWRDDPILDLEKLIIDSAPSALNSVATDHFALTSSLTTFFENYTKRFNTKLLIILDQFEEYFLYHADRGENAFAEEFSRAVNHPALNANFLVSIRDDALANLDYFKGRIPNLFDNYLRVNHLNLEAARSAIEKPIEQYNRLYSTEGHAITIEPTLVEAVLDQLKTENLTLGEAGRGVVKANNVRSQIEAPFLQLVMIKLWEEEMRVRSRKVHFETLNKLGGAKRIVRSHLDSTLEKLGDHEQDVAARVFHYLVTPSGTKIAHTVSDLVEYTRLPQEQITPVINKLAQGKARILRPVPPPTDHQGETRYEIFHDVLAPAILDWRSRHIQTQQLETTRQRLVSTQQFATRVRYWLVVLVITIAGIYIGNWIAAQDWWINFRYKVYQSLHSINSRSPHPSRTVLIMISDDEYWGELQGRVPIRRDYLARLVAILDEADPAVIAIDFDLRSPSTDKNLTEYPDYQAETLRLLQTIKDVSRHRTIVLPKTLGVDEESLSYLTKPDIYDGFDFGGGIVQTGYIALSDDIRQIPLSLPIKGGTSLDSFSQAIVRSYVPRGPLDAIPQDASLPYEGFIAPRDFITYSSGQILQLSPLHLKDQIAHKIIIIGGQWHAKGNGEGALIDSYTTPVGLLPASYIHANYVEAILDGRIWGDWNSSGMTGIKILLMLLISLIYSLNIKWPLKFTATILLCLGTIAGSYFFFIEGILIDTFLPLIMLFIFFGLEQVRTRRIQHE